MRVVFLMWFSTCAINGKLQIVPNLQQILQSAQPTASHVANPGQWQKL
jgi:hypothetical protein